MAPTRNAPMEVQKETKRSIFLALIRLMKEQPLDEISISTLTKEAGVSRASFYRHFDDKMSVIRWYSAEIFENFLQTLSAHKSDKLSNQHVAYTSFYYWKENAELLEVLIANEVDHLLMDQMREFTERAPILFEYENEVERHYKLSFFTGGMFRLVRDWVKSGRRESIDEMSAILSSVM